jgi:hypothetical protein
MLAAIDADALRNCEVLPNISDRGKLAVNL